MLASSTSSIFVEWLSEGSGTGSRKKLIQGMKAINILNEGIDDQDYRNAQIQMLQDLTDTSILDFDEYGNWTVQSTRIAIVRHSAGDVRAVVCGARDSRVNSALEALPSSVTKDGFGQFGLQILGPIEAVQTWAEQHRFPVDLHWVGFQVKYAIDQLGFTSAKRAAELVGEIPGLSSINGPIWIRKLKNGFRRETISFLPRHEPGVVLEVEDQYTARRRRYVGTMQGWFKVPYAWAPWICAASIGKQLTQICPGERMSVPLWARLPDRLSRAVALGSGETWAVSGGKLVSGRVPSALAFNLKRLLS